MNQSQSYCNQTQLYSNRMSISNGINQEKMTEFDCQIEEK